MALNDYAYYNTTTGLIENIVWLDDEAISSLVDYPPQGYAIVDIPTGGIAGAWSMCGIGWSYIDGQFVEPPNPNATAILTAGISSTDMLIPVDSTDTFYSSGYLVIGVEIMSYNGITVNSITVTERGLNGTTAVAYVAGAEVKSSQVMPKLQPQTTGSQDL